MPRRDMKVGGGKLLGIRFTADEYDVGFHALAERNRRQLLVVLAGTPGMTIMDLMIHVTLRRQAMTKHLDVLEKAQMVTKNRSGPGRRYYINRQQVLDVANHTIRNIAERTRDGWS